MMETNLFRERGNWISRQQWDYPLNNSFNQPAGVFGPSSEAGVSWRFKPRTIAENSNQRWSATGFQLPQDNAMQFNRNLPWSREKDVNQWSPGMHEDQRLEPLFPKDPSIQRGLHWTSVGNKGQYPQPGTKGPWPPAANAGSWSVTGNKGPWAPRQDLITSNGLQQHWRLDPPFQSNISNPVYSRNSESKRGMPPISSHSVAYSHQRSWKDHKSERESKKNYENYSKRRRPSFFKPEKKRWHNSWAREAAEALKEEKPSKFKEEQPTTVSGPRVEVEYCGKKCRASQLHEACNSGELEKVQEILNQPTVELEARDDIFWETPLMWATRLGKQEIIKAVYDKGASLWVASKDGATLLHLAVLSGDVKIVKYINKTTQIDIDHPDKSGKTALMLAALRGHLDIVKYLIDNGANTEMWSKKRTNILLLAVESGNLELVKYLLDNTELAHNINCLNADEHTPLMLASRAGFLEICRLLIQHGANCNVVDPDGRTPLHAAAEKGFSEVVDCLLEQNLILHIQDRNGRTPVQVAVQHKYIPVTISLLEKGASMDIPDRKGRTVLHIAAENGLVEIFHYLEKCNRNGDYQARTKQCWYTPIHCAAKAGHLDIVQWLIQHGVDPNITDRDLNVPLHAAALDGHLEVVKFLIGVKASVNQRNKGGETPLHFAAMWNHLSVVEHLCENGADVNVRDSWGQTALQVAQKGNCSDAMKYLEQKQTPQDCP